MVAPRVFLDFTLDGAPLGRVIFELFHISAPKTAENFRALCTGERGVSPRSDVPLYYKHSKIHRVIPDFMIQGGDFTKGNGTGGESIYGAPFADEDLSRPVDEAGLLCMANKGPNTNNSQFFITLRPSPHLTGKHVVFGRVIRGFEDVIVKGIVGRVKTDEKDRPTVPVEVVNCGELQLVRRPSSALKVEKSRVGGEESGSEREEERGRKRRRRSSDRSRSRSPSDSRSGTRDRSYSRSRSPISESESEAERKKRKKRSRKEKKSKKDKKEKKSKKGKHHRSRSPSASHSRSRSRPIDATNGDGIDHKPPPREETEEEYDARLEREERERIEAARLRELAEIKRRFEEERERAKEKSGGVRYKGRGKMKFVDPEMRSRRYD